MNAQTATETVATYSEEKAIDLYQQIRDVTKPRKIRIHGMRIS